MSKDSNYQSLVLARLKQLIAASSNSSIVGVSTEAKQDDMITALSNILTQIGDNATETTLQSIETILQNISFSANNEVVTLDTTGKLIPTNYDEIDITQFVTTGNAAGQPEIIEYKESGSTVATLNITYNVDGCVSRIQRV